MFILWPCADWDLDLVFADVGEAGLFEGIDWVPEERPVDLFAHLVKDVDPSLVR